MLFRSRRLEERLAADGPRATIDDLLRIPLAASTGYDPACDNQLPGSVVRAMGPR